MSSYPHNQTLTRARGRDFEAYLTGKYEESRWRTSWVSYPCCDCATDRERQRRDEGDEGVSDARLLSCVCGSRRESEKRETRASRERESSCRNGKERGREKEKKEIENRVGARDRKSEGS